MMMNCFCGMVDRRKTFSLISSRDHSQRSSPSRISDTPRAGFELAQNLSSGLVEWNCAVGITTTPRRHKFSVPTNRLTSSQVPAYEKRQYSQTETRKSRKFIKNPKILKYENVTSKTLEIPFKWHNLEMIELHW